MFFTRGASAEVGVLPVAAEPDGCDEELDAADEA
jgi:hypothetical protein